MKLLKRFEQIYERYKVRREYRKLRNASIEALKKGDVKRSVAIDARADRILNRVIYQ